MVGVIGILGKVFRSGEQATGTDFNCDGAINRGVAALVVKFDVKRCRVAPVGAEFGTLRLNFYAACCAAPVNRKFFRGVGFTFG